jgi:hypothetical protein
VIDTWTATGVTFACSEPGAGLRAGTWRPNLGLSTAGLLGMERFTVPVTGAMSTAHVPLMAPVAPTTNPTSAVLFRQIYRGHDTDFGTKSQDPPRGTLS